VVISVSVNKKKKGDEQKGKFPTFCSSRLYDRASGDITPLKIDANRGSDEGAQASVFSSGAAGASSTGAAGAAGAAGASAFGAAGAGGAAAFCGVGMGVNEFFTPGSIA
jgi:hypothetical protein